MSHFLLRSLILSRRPLDDDSTKGFYKWPFMTTHAWAERASGVWKLEVRFDTDENEFQMSSLQNQTRPDKTENKEKVTGELYEWSLVLHGTKTAPYDAQTPLAIHGDKSKLAIAKQIHANNFQEKAKFVKLLKQDNQKRIGSDDEIRM